MADIKTITQELWSGSNDSNYISASGSLVESKDYVNNIEIRQSNADDMMIYVLKKKIDELVAEVNILKNQ
tara:strand:+ start:1420 stop:1629 length:210 start_codon:yes stop_codon:yes gene_type:complete